MSSYHFPTIILGSGPAGITAALYTARARMHPLVFEGLHPGGQLMGTALVENWPGIKSIFGPLLIQQCKEHAESFGAQFRIEEIIKVDLSQRPFTLISSSNTLYTCSILIIATGASPKKIGCRGEDQYWGKGVTTCAVCDGAFYENKSVLVVGGGNSGAENALFLTKYASTITLIHRSAHLSASPILQERVSKARINILYNSTLAAIEGEHDRVTRADIMNRQTGAITTLLAEGIFVSVGTQPNTSLFKDFLEHDPYGYLLTKEDRVSTSIPGVFVAGDVSNPFHRQAIVSAGTGCIAALEAERYYLHQGETI